MSYPRQHTADEVSLALAGLDLVGIVREAFIDHHRRRTVLPAEACLRWSDPDGHAARSIAMHAFLLGPPARIGMKVINASLGNPDRGLPRASGFIALFDPETAVVTDLLPAAEISAVRTAAVSSAAAVALASPGPHQLAVIGAGPLAEMHVRAMTTALEIKRLTLFDLDRGRAAKLADAADPVGEVAASAEDAIRGATVVVTATTTTEPYIPPAWISPGAVVVNVSLDDLLPEVLLESDALYVDDWSMVVADEHRMLGRLAREGKVVLREESGAGDARVLTGELGALFAGAVPGRTGERQRIVVNPFGLAISDVAIAAAVVRSMATDRGG